MSARAAEQKHSVQEPQLPLCVDLDGTLVRSDTLIESLASGLRNWRIWRAFLTLFTKGRAAMKQAVAQIEPVDAATLPYNDELLDYLRAEKALGRELILVTASDQTTAAAVNAHLQLFDSVMASDGVCNLKGERKAAALVERFGERGFVYAGNDRSDLIVWRRAKSAIVINATASVAAEARKAAHVEHRLHDTRSKLRAVLKAARPYQWVKNLLILVPIATAHALNDASAWISAGWTFAAFCATASGIYIFNDLSDLKADRLHARKRRRPFASGTLSLPLGLVLTGVLLSAGAIFAVLSGAMWVVALYAVTSISYSMWLKEFPLVDIFVLAGLYTLRLFAGGEATGHPVSFWLLGFSSFFFLSLALVKRVSEMMAVSGTSAARRGYMATDVPVLQLMGIASGFTAIVILSLFVQDEATSLLYSSPALLWCIVPLMLFWLCRIWLSTARGYMHDDPIVYAAKDWVSWLVTIAVFGALAAAKTLTLTG
ncbi:MAG TPA: UbiA family prenyltransferase [Micropepsaceae bacterium]|jgi:4-hydroxybenzoate polyprenyltransferase|nr:UbiA family prenyltransferase [Micropepsaceae bacterium]